MTHHHDGRLCNHVRHHGVRLCNHVSHEVQEPPVLQVHDTFPGVMSQVVGEHKQPQQVQRACPSFHLLLTHCSQVQLPHPLHYPPLLGPAAGSSALSSCPPPVHHMAQAVHHCVQEGHMGRRYCIHLCFC